MVADAPDIGNSLSAESREFFAQVTGLLGAAGIPSALNPRLVRGLDYYAHTTLSCGTRRSRGRRTRSGAAAATTAWPKCWDSPPPPGAGYSLGVERSLAVCRIQGWDREPARRAVAVLGVGRRRPRPPQVARALREAGIAALLGTRRPAPRPAELSGAAPVQERAPR